jgi:TonB family protein
MSVDQQDTFVGASDVEPRGLRRPLPASVGIHALLLIALLRGRSPVFVAPTSVLGGANGTAITHLYWASGSADSDTGAASASQARKNAHTRLTWKKPKQTAATARQDTPSPEVNEQREVASASAAPAPSAGSRYGSLSDGSANGQEIRPALPLTTSEPLVSSEDLHGVPEGNVVIEITIDEGGNIVSKAVVQSLGPVIDSKVLLALENWRFRPATRDGVPIPSKQDVVYHFKPR